MSAVDRAAVDMEWINAATDDERRSVANYFIGWSPQGFAYARAMVERERAVRAEFIAKLTAAQS